jgi:cystathionine beta-synthase
MVKVNHLDTGPCDLFLKLESTNPGGSIKDRIGLSMVEAAEKEGKLKPGGTMVEATAGNTGLALALVAGQKGYKLTLVIPDKMSQEKMFHLKAMGAEVVVTRSDVGKGHPEYYQDIAARIAQETGAFYVNQFENPANPAAHEKYTAPEIWEQMEGKMDALVCGVGSGGTLTGIGRYFKRVAPHVEMILADPKGSILAPLVNEGKMTKAGSWLVEGIGEDFIPGNCELDLVKKAYAISDAESIDTSREVLKQEGIFCGSSSGTLINAALKYCREQKEHKRVVSFVCDSGNKYLSKIYNDYWLRDYGFVERAQTHDLRDLISRPYSEHSAIVVKPDDSLQTAYRKLKDNDVSQMPVIEDGKLVGILGEIDILVHTSSDPLGFDLKVKDAMTSRLMTIQASRAADDLVPILQHGLTAIVMEGDNFLGLVTPIDFLQYMRKRAAK